MIVTVHQSSINIYKDKYTTQHNYTEFWTLRCSILTFRVTLITIIKVTLSIKVTPDDGKLTCNTDLLFDNYLQYIHCHNHNYIRHQYSGLFHDCYSCERRRSLMLNLKIQIRLTSN